MPKGQNSKPKTGFAGSRKTGFSGLEKLRVTRFFGFGQNRVCNPNLNLKITPTLTVKVNETSFYRGRNKNSACGGLPNMSVESIDPSVDNYASNSLTNFEFITFEIWSHNSFYSRL